MGTGPGTSAPPVNHLFLATACQDADHAALLQKYCLPQFQVDMEAIGKALWCDWDKTIGWKRQGSVLRVPRWSLVDVPWCRPSHGPALPLTLGELRTRSYKDLSDCTRLVAQRLDCFWPNAAVDKFFLGVHQQYFRSCPVSGRALQDPPSSVLCPFIVVPILATLLMTALVVWRSKRPEGIV
ncbi:receptor activity-modifying protein 1 isoform X1 [Phacochoerus africanus]|uniref:receptor activity-modifying protein 1 isoform X1 n=1 Tax=Phacochoerus africanus TaxID=41426 RepID=UPI001FDA238D|nr:receptor activity-modifying protein 1 isoform X1 [Phacochoerus africanus]